MGSPETWRIAGDIFDVVSESFGIIFGGGGSPLRGGRPQAFVSGRDGSLANFLIPHCYQ